MAILQVNVRPAATSRSLSPRRGGQLGEFHTRFRWGTSPATTSIQKTLNSDFSQQSAANPSSTESTDWQTIVWKLMPGTTVGRAQLSATQRLREAGSPSSSLDAQLLLAHLYGVERSWLFAHYDHELSAESADAYAELIARRARGEPIAYLVGQRDFYDLTLQVNDSVLIPRPETELLVDAALTYIARRERTVKQVKAADIGTGSGAIALAVARHAPKAHVTAVDISPAALEVARANAQALDLTERVTFCQGNLLEPLTERVHLIMANLPYVNAKDYAELDPGVRDFEPETALLGGADGLDLIRTLLAAAPDYLLPGGQILLEIGYDQRTAVTTLANKVLPGRPRIDVTRDYAGHDRVVHIQMG
ncbi:MAG: peptide chain release factor N(5)-glutamine methyltransferase [Caldilineaceae bacterium]|nr:peptide chain release factor N(5)-glutamine methyltransferase [Caldilineaceae bacterium]